MGKILSQRIKQKKFESPYHEAGLNLLVASNFVKKNLEKTFKKYGLTRGQFNILRILNGVYPDGYPRYEIISRMLEPSPDVTRIIDNLEKKGYVVRYRPACDQRQSSTKIIQKGQELLSKMNKEVSAKDKEILAKNLTESECLELSRLLEKIYG